MHIAWSKPLMHCPSQISLVSFTANQKLGRDSLVGHRSTFPELLGRLQRRVGRCHIRAAVTAGRSYSRPVVDEGVQVRTNLNIPCYYCKHFILMTKIKNGQAPCSNHTVCKSRWPNLSVAEFLNVGIHTQTTSSLCLFAHVLGPDFTTHPGFALLSSSWSLSVQLSLVSFFWHHFMALHWGIFWPALFVPGQIVCLCHQDVYSTICYSAGCLFSIDIYCGLMLSFFLGAKTQNWVQRGYISGPSFACSQRISICCQNYTHRENVSNYWYVYSNEKPKNDLQQRLLTPHPPTQMIFLPAVI